MRRYFILLSGELVKLSQEEIFSILEANNTPFQGGDLFERLLVISMPHAPDISRGALFHFLCEEILRTSKAVSDISDSVSKTDFTRYLDPRDTFCVRIKRVKDASRANVTPTLEKEIGGIIQGQTGCKVNLRNPQRLFRGVFVADHFFLGVQIFENSRKTFDDRKPSKRDYFMPTSMHPLLARALVNLGRTRENTVFLDPFVGTGGFLIEAERIGCQCIGSDVKTEVIRGVRKNVSEKTSLIVADGQRIPLRVVDCISTDLPYGKNSAVFGQVNQIISRFTAEANRLLKDQTWVCFVTDSSADSKAVLSTFKEIKYFDYYVHKSLTRRIWVCKTVKI